MYNYIKDITPIHDNLSVLKVTDSKINDMK